MENVKRVYRLWKDNHEYHYYYYGRNRSRKCKAHTRRTKVPCQAWAMHGCVVCMFHGGRAGRPVPEGKVKNLPGLTEEETLSAFQVLKGWLEDLLEDGVDVKNMDKTMLAEAAAMYIKSNRNLTDVNAWKEFKYKDLFLKFVKELSMTRKERLKSTALANIAQSFDMVLSHGDNKSKTQRVEKEE